MVERQSPYLEHQARLADVIAALQVMSTYKFASRHTPDWEKSIGRAPLSSETWGSVFLEHPEFFRVKDEWASLVWRRASEKLFDTHGGREISKEEFDKLLEDQRRKISRAPLSAEQTTALVEVAIKLQTQAISRRSELRWWLPVLIGAIGIAIGALIKS